MADHGTHDVLGGDGAREVDPSELRTRAQFGWAITALREKRGLTVRDVAKVTGLPISTLGGYFAGRHLPPLKPVGQLALLLRALGVGDDAVDAWTEALNRLRRAQNTRIIERAAPYRGLACFEPEDAEWFFGREQLTAELVKRTSAAGLLAVVGPSGSGKSSLLRSGLISALKLSTTDDPAADNAEAAARHTSAPVVLLTPGALPLQALEAALAAAGCVACGGSLVANLVAGGLGPITVVADQFEEIFTQCGDEAERRRAIDVFCEAGLMARVVLGIRADFYGLALMYPKLAQLMQRNQVVVGPMSEVELRRAIAEPARHAGVGIQPELTERLLRDLGMQVGTDTESFHQAGALPLLSHALLSTWERAQQQATTMTLADYLAVGGIAGGVARTAEHVYRGFDDESRRFARQLFIRLVLVSDDTGDTRSRLPLRELFDQGLRSDERERREQVIDSFIGARLLTAHEASIEITHEALLTAWPKLREWLAVDREWLQRHRALSLAALQWRDSQFDPDQLYRGTRLQLIRELIEDGARGSELNDLESRFIDESVSRARDEVLRDRRRVRRNQRYVALVTVLVMCLAGAAFYAHGLRSTDGRERAQALSRLVADESDRLRGDDPSLSMQLALTAYRIAPTPEALSSLLDSTGTTPDTRILVTPTPSVAPDAESIAIGGNLLAVGTGSGTVNLWTISSGRATPVGRPMKTGGAAVATVSLTKDGRLLAAGTADGVVDLWDISALSKPRALATITMPAGTGILSVALSRDGRLLAAGTDGGRVGLWLVSDPSHPIPESPAQDSTEPVNGVAFNAAGTVLAAGGSDTRIRLWHLDVSGHPSPYANLAAGSVVFTVAISPDGRTLAVGTGAGHDVALWNLTNSGNPTSQGTITGPGSWVNSVAFSQDGRTLGAASSDGRLWLYDTATRLLIRKLPHPNTVTGVAFLADGSPVTVSVDDGTIRWWRLPGPVIVGARDSIFAVNFTADGRFLGVGPGSRDDTLTLWNVTDPHNPVRAAGALPGLPKGGAYSGSGALSPSGESFAAGDLDGTVQVWDVRNPKHQVRPEPPFSASNAMVESVDFTRDGRVLEASADDGTVHLYDVTAPGRLSSRAVITTPNRGKIYQSAFSPDGGLLAAASNDGDTYVYALGGGNPRLIATLVATVPSYSVTFLANDTVAVGDSTGATRIWHVGSNTKPVLLAGPLGGPVGYNYALAYARGTLAISGSQDGTIWLWNVTDPASPVHIATITASSNGVFSLALRADGQVLAAGGVDDTVQLWSTDPGTAASWVCAMAGTPLTMTEWRQDIPGRTYDPPCSTAGWNIGT